MGVILAGSNSSEGDNILDHEGGSGDSHQSDHGFSNAALSDHRKDGNSYGASTARGDAHPSQFVIFSNVDDKSPIKAFKDSG